MKSKSCFVKFPIVGQAWESGIIIVIIMFVCEK